MEPVFVNAIIWIAEEKKKITLISNKSIRLISAKG